MLLQDLVHNVSGFAEWKHPEKIKFFGWYLHTQRSQERFNQADIRSCYDELHLEKPHVSSYFSNLSKRKPKQLLHDRSGYYLAKQVRDALDAKYGQRPSTVQVDKLLAELPNKIPNLTQRDFLKEAFVCVRYGAPRAAIVMCWNLAFDHLCDYILAKHLSSFNMQLPKSYPKHRIKTINTKDDFEELKESEILQVCRSANITSSGIHKILTEKLGRRNMAAHPSNIVITPLQVEDFITDLINNVVLKLS
jgi:hypothetical protein